MEIRQVDPEEACRLLEAALLLAERGFNDLTNLDGGTRGWAQRGFPLEV